VHLGRDNPTQPLSRQLWASTFSTAHCLYAVLAGSGLRIGECFALRVEDVRGTVLNVESSAWEGTICDPKTKNGVREVDIHSSLAEQLEKHIGRRTTGFVFPSERSTPPRKSNVLRRSLHPILKKMGKPLCGFHAFRRFRAAHLDKELVPEILVHIWMGHSNRDMQQRYSRSGVKIDSLFRTMTAQRAGLVDISGIKAIEVPKVSCESRPVAPTSTLANSLNRWSGREDLNLRPPGPEPGALPG